MLPVPSAARPRIVVRRRTLVRGLGITGSIALPLVLQALPDVSLPGQMQAGSPEGDVLRAAGLSPLGIRQASPLAITSATTSTPVRGAASPAEALRAAFAALPSPFATDRAPSLFAGSDPAAAAGAAEPLMPLQAGGSPASRLGGALSLADRLSTPVEAFRSPQSRSLPIEADTTDPLPSLWSDHLRALVSGTPLVLPVEVVRMRSAAVREARTIPMALWPDGSATTNVENPDQAGQSLAHDWVRQQPALSEGSVRPVLMVLEPEGSPAPDPEAGTAAATVSEPAMAAPAAAAATPAPQPDPAPQPAGAADLGVQALGAVAPAPLP